MTAGEFVNKPGRVWQITTAVLLIVSIGLLVALIVVASEKDKTKYRTLPITSDGQEVSICGQGSSNPNGNSIDLSEPTNPGPFHDLTTEELKKLRTFLENDPEIRAIPMEKFRAINCSYIYMADLWLPPKAEVIKFLDNGEKQPERQARVMMFRGDKTPPIVEEWICGPLPDVTNCQMLNFTNRRNPVEFEARPFNLIEFITLSILYAHVDNKIGHILLESYNATFTGCADPMECLAMNPVPTASGLTGKLYERRIWFWALYNIPYRLLHPVDFGIQVQVDGAKPEQWGINYIWYAGQVFSGLDDLNRQYNFGNITKTKMTKPVYSDDLFSTLHRRGDPLPVNPQRAPVQVEPDGKRYSVRGRKIDYLGWSFNFRLSSFQGPQLFDIRFQGDRIAYELSLAEIAAFYSGDSPLSQATDYVDSGALSAMGTKSLVPGGDCPESATLIDYVSKCWRNRTHFFFQTP
ncbi:amine oxidase [Plakobranchus ocellatus]|uniref:Amine oxidase n=1 Tax=Plakobranchus ocellatus TaxID=259542 RepID=A0AAV4BS42_9GAST|nr:amine oxidase [Plakobranchus ocellatus]